MRNIYFGSAEIKFSNEYDRKISSDSPGGAAEDGVDKEQEVAEREIPALLVS